MVENQSGFLGEIEFREGLLPSGEFGDFESLANIQWIHDLAHEFAQSLELMPYQMAGDSKRLLVSVYVETRMQNGRVIAVLTRDPYPSDWDALVELMKKAVERMNYLYQLEAIYTRASITAAGAALMDLLNKMESFRKDHPDWQKFEQIHSL